MRRRRPPGSISSPRCPRISCWHRALAPWSAPASPLPSRRSSRRRYGPAPASLSRSALPSSTVRVRSMPTTVARSAWSLSISATVPTPCGAAIASTSCRRASERSADSARPAHPTNRCVRPMELTDTQFERYARHLILDEVGEEGQARLLSSRVLVVGAGGLGAPLLLYLAAAGVGTLGVIDDDVVDLSNLQRQVIHTTERVGMPKV